MFAFHVAERRSIDGGGRSRETAPADAWAIPALSANRQNETFPEEHLVIADETQAVQEGREPPFVVEVEGEVAPNGKAIGLRIRRSAQGPIDLCLRTQDVQHMVGIMLALGCEAMRLQGMQEMQPPPNGAIPLPLTAINIGEDEGNQTFLMLEVGAAALMFGMPSVVLEELAQTLLALSARKSTKPS
jgi:hypothetical protein